MNDICVSIGSIRTPQLGEIWVAVSDRGLTTVEFSVKQTAFEATVRHQIRAEITDDSELRRQMIEAATCQIAEYLEGRRRAFDLRIDWSVLGSDFQRTALRAVMAVPYGETRTYGRLAAQIGYPKAPRAVGRANAINPMPLVIPCHRLIGSDGKLHGYGGAGGLQTKRWLLELEGAIPSPASLGASARR